MFVKVDRPGFTHFGRLPKFGPMSYSGIISFEGWANSPRELYEKVRVRIKQVLANARGRDREVSSITTETFVTGVPVEAKPAVGERVRDYARTRLQGSGHLEAAVHGSEGGRLTVTHATVYPHTAEPYDVREDLEAYLNQAA